MMLWPLALRAVYPAAPDRHPDRPWWTLWKNAHGAGATRSDGASIHTIVSDTVTRLSFTLGGGAAMPLGLPFPSNVDIAAWMAAADRHVPLPHPGVRVGQVWAFMEGEFWRVIQVVDASVLGCLRVVPRGGTALDLPSEAYLIADPCCPWFAPWAPSGCA